jgi:3-oxoacyl-[acyl-carrier protein] reductase
MFKNFDAIQVGDQQSLTKHITLEDVRRFVDMTGDDNPLHVDRAYAETTPFKDIVVHGMLGASFISTVIGTKLPGTGALWVSQNMEFLLPVRLGDELTITCTVTRKHERDRLIELDTVIMNQHGKTVLQGSGKVRVLASKAPEPAEALQASRVAIVTGGSGGIGKAICLRLAQDGYDVVVNYRGQSDRAQEIAEEVNAAGKGRALAIKADISTEAGARALADAATRAFGSVNVLVNNASPRINAKEFAAMGWDDMQQHLDVQLKGAFLMCAAVVPGMVQSGGGRIVNITSQVVEGQPSVTWTSYATAKGALAVFSRYLAAELGPKKITVNCVAPGMCETSLIGDVPEKAQLMIARQTPLRRLARPQDVAEAVAYLASEAGAFVTGQTLSINGGAAMR